MNEVRVSARAVFEPGAKKHVQVQAYAETRMSVFLHGIPPVVSKAASGGPVKTNPVEFYLGPDKIVPVKGTASAKVIPTRVTAAATVKPRNFVTKDRAVAHARRAYIKGADFQPRDRKLAVSRATHNPEIVTTRKYSIYGSAMAAVTYLRPLVPRDRKTATAKAVFGSFSPRPPSFAWR